MAVARLSWRNGGATSGMATAFLLRGAVRAGAQRLEVLGGDHAHELARGVVPVREHVSRARAAGVPCMSLDELLEQSEVRALRHAAQLHERGVATRREVA